MAARKRRTLRPFWWPRFVPNLEFSCTRILSASVAHDYRTSGIAKFGEIALAHVLYNDEKYRVFKRKQFFPGRKIAWLCTKIFFDRICLFRFACRMLQIEITIVVVFVYSFHSLDAGWCMLQIARSASRRGQCHTRGQSLDCAGWMKPVCLWGSDYRMLPCWLSHLKAEVQDEQGTKGQRLVPSCLHVPSRWN